MYKRRIAVIIGTKAELIKCMPVMLELQKQKIDYWFIHTGQHPLGKACDEFGVKKPDFILSEEPDISTKFWSKINNISIFWFFQMIFKIRKLVRKLKPKYVIYHGDTMSTAAAGIGSSSLLNSRREWHNVHLEAGLRSGGLLEPFPEEISRQICDYFSDTLLSVSKLTDKNLKKAYRRRKKIINTGNTVIDSSLITFEKAVALKKFKKINEKYVLINLHRHENLNSRKRMGKIVEILNSVKIKGIWPLHDNTEYYLKKYGLMDKIKEMKNIEIRPLTDYFDFMFLMANCEYLITDGGSIQEESLVFRKPCIILREKTERQEGLSSGINFLTRINVKETQRIIKDIEENKIKIKNFTNPYGKKGLSKKIVEILK